MAIILKVREFIIHTLVLLVTLTSATAVNTETAKLLYVACTRALHELHILTN